MTKTLDEQIAARKQQAEDRKIFEKASLVAEKLGKRGWSENHGSFSRVSHTFNDAAGSLVVRHDFDEDHRKDPEVSSTHYSATVSYKGKEVFKGGFYGVDLYIPGAWEKKLEAWLPAVQHVVEKQQVEATRRAAEKKRAEETAKRKQWGL